MKYPENISNETVSRHYCAEVSRFCKFCQGVMFLVLLVCLSSGILKVEIEWINEIHDVIIVIYSEVLLYTHLMHE